MGAEMEQALRADLAEMNSRAMEAREEADDAKARLKACRTMLEQAHARLDDLGAPRHNDNDLPTEQSVAERIGWVARNRVASPEELWREGYDAAVSLVEIAGALVDGPGKLAILGLRKTLASQRDAMEERAGALGDSHQPDTEAE